MIGCHLKTAVLQGMSRRTEKKPVAVPNGAVPNKYQINLTFQMWLAVPCGSNNAQQSPTDRSFSCLSHSK